VGVSQAAVSKAVAAGRIPAKCVVKTNFGKQLYRESALLEWQRMHPEESECVFTQDELEKYLSVEGAADASDLDEVEWAKLKTKK